MWRLVILGPPGSGKSTQAERLSDEHHLAHLSTGEMLRAEVARATTIGQEVGQYLAKGHLVPPQVVNRLIHEKLNQVREQGFVLDGYPRSVEQAQALDENLEQLALSLDAVLVIEIPQETAVERLAARMVCAGCGATYNLDEIERAEAECRQCGGKLMRRDDDEPEVVRERFVVYQREMLPVLERYRHKGVLVSIDGQGSRPEVYTRLKGVLAKLRP